MGWQLHYMYILIWVIDKTQSDYPIKIPTPPQKIKKSEGVCYIKGSAYY